MNTAQTTELLCLIDALC